MPTPAFLRTAPARLCRAALLVLALQPWSASPALAQPAPIAQEKHAVPGVDLSASAERSAANDLAVAVLYAEHSAATPAAVASELNRRIAAALQLAASHADVDTRSGNSSTWPVYAKEGGGQIEAWRMRSEIRLESRKLGAMSELIGTLQNSLALSQITLQPSPETRRGAIDAATVAALRAFEQRAELIAGALGKRYRITHLSVGDGDLPPPVLPRMRVAALAAEAAAAPLEGGESRVSVHVSGRIELID